MNKIYKSGICQLFICRNHINCVCWSFTYVHESYINFCYLQEPHIPYLLSTVFTDKNHRSGFRLYNFLCQEPCIQYLFVTFYVKDLISSVYLSRFSVNKNFISISSYLFFCTRTSYPVSTCSLFYVKESHIQYLLAAFRVFQLALRGGGRMRNFAESGIFLSGGGNLRMELDRANRWLKSKVASSVLTEYVVKTIVQKQRLQDGFFQVV